MLVIIKLSYYTYLCGCSTCIDYNNTYIDYFYYCINDNNEHESKEKDPINLMNDNI